MQRLIVLEHEADASSAWTAIRKVYENTGTRDIGLRQSITEYCIRNQQCIRHMREICNALEHEPTAWSLALKIQEQHENELARMEEKLSEQVAAASQAGEEIEAFLNLIRNGRRRAWAACRQEDMLIDCFEDKREQTKHDRYTCKCCSH